MQLFRAALVPQARLVTLATILREEYMKHAIRISLLLISVSATLLAQNNAVPFLNQPTSPSTAFPGTSAFTLTVHGTGFATGAVLNWNGSPRATTVISGGSLQASITAADIAKAGTGIITVTNPVPGGGTSLPVYFFVRATYASVALVNGPRLPNFGPVAVGDFDGDHNLDVAVAQEDPTQKTPGTIQLYLGKGDGTFQTARSTITSTDTTVQPTQIVAGDFNGDGKLDLLVAQFTNVVFGGVGTQVFFGNGDGTFTAGPAASGCGGNDYGEPTAVADLNSDGILDFVFVGGNQGQSWPTVCLGNGDGTFQRSFAGFSNVSQSASVGDFNNDNKLDFFSADSNGSTFLGNGDGTFQGPLEPGGYGTVAVGDINLDGNPDVVIANGNVWLGNGDGTFSSGTALSGAPGNDIALQDIQGANVLSAVVLGSSLLIYPGGSFNSGKFGNPVQFAVPPVLNNGRLGLGDFNHDGRVDFVVPGTTSTTILLQTRLGIAPLSLNYGTVPLGNSVIQTITLTNVGSPNLPVKSISVVGVDAKDFSIAPNKCVGVVTSDGACSFNVKFTPRASGPRNASVQIVYGDVGSPRAIPISGVGTPVALSPVSVNFGDQKVGTTSPPVTVTMSNLGGSAVAINDIAILGGASFGETNNCGSSLAAHSSCAIKVTFTPNGLGGHSGTLKVRFAAAGGEESVSLSGTGT
jgi:hypothetical protein